MQVVGITGYAGAGKSTAAQYLVEQHGFTRVSFAAPLKKMLRTLDPIISNHGIRLSQLLSQGWAEDRIKKSSYGDEYRRLLQVLGTDCIRAEDPEFWINAADRQLVDDEARYVFDDCRFPNEADFIKSRNPLGLWHVGRAGIHAANGHPSEQHAGRMGETQWIENNYNGNPELFCKPIPVTFFHEQIDAALEAAFGGVKA